MRSLFLYYSLLRDVVVPFQILFEFTRGEDTTNFALDDVTLTQGTCGN